MLFRSKEKPSTPEASIKDYAADEGMRTHFKQFQI
jgi:hypothetical protein